MLTKERGFTLVELLVVIAIIGLLSSVIIASVNNARTKGQYARNLQLDANYNHNLGDSLVGQWLFDDCPTTSAKDTSGFNNHGSMTGSVASSPDSPFGSGCSLYFSGGWVNVSSPSQLNISGDVAIAAWIKMSVTSGGGPIVQDRGSGAGHSLSLGVGSNGARWSCPSQTGGLYFADDSDGMIIGQYYTGSLNDNMWHFVVGAFSAPSGVSVTASQFSVYVEIGRASCRERV